MSAIPVHIITGPLGVGKTTAIAGLLANKPATESWLVVLNEFTDTGVDALTLAMQVRGAYDLRMIPGGCLCCTGEEDFRRQLSTLLAADAAQWPKRMLIEPSGIGHPGGIIDELRLFERSGALKLVSTIALLDAARVPQADTLDETTRAQLAAADVLLLAKADQASDAQRAEFMRFAEGQFPRKRFVGFSEQGRVPAQALQPPDAPFEFEISGVATPRAHAHQHAHAPHIVRSHDVWHGQAVQRAQFSLLQRQACGWTLARELLFDRTALESLLRDASRWSAVERFKAVLRVGVDEWLMLQRWHDQHSIAPGVWHADNRIEVQLQPDQPAHWQTWHDDFARMTSRCPVG